MRLFSVLKAIVSIPPVHEALKKGLCTCNIFQTICQNVRGQSFDPSCDFKINPAHQIEADWKKDKMAIHTHTKTPSSVLSHHIMFLLSFSLLSNATFTWRDYQERVLNSYKFLFIAILVQNYIKECHSLTSHLTHAELQIYTIGRFTRSSGWSTHLGETGTRSSPQRREQASEQVSFVHGSSVVFLDLGDDGPFCQLVHRSVRVKTHCSYTSVSFLLRVPSQLIGRFLFCLMSSSLVPSRRDKVQG